MGTDNNRVYAMSATIDTPNNIFAGAYGEYSEISYSYNYYYEGIKK